MSNKIATIAGSVGKNGINDRDDVYLIQDLLEKVRAIPLPCVTGEYDYTLDKAISDFQRACDIEQSGIVNTENKEDKTFELLLKTANPKNLKLEEIKLMSIGKGGYYIDYKKDFIPPNEYKVMLYLAGETQDISKDAIDITKPPRSKGTGYMDKEKLIKLLDLIGSRNLWSKRKPFEKPRFCVYLTRDGQIISSSNAQTLSPPARPYTGKIQLKMDGNEYSTHYTEATRGRYFWPVFHKDKRGNELHYFVYLKGDNNEEERIFTGGGTVLETIYELGGFDCQSYVGTVLGIDPSTHVMGGVGRTIADYVNREPTYFEEKLFNWNKISESDGGISGNENAKLKNFLMRKYEDVVWVNKAIIKIDDDKKTIKLTEGTNSGSLKLNEENNKVDVEIKGKKDEFTVRKENDELNLYEKGVLMENINFDILKKYFQKNITGAFVVWTESPDGNGHVFLVVDCVLHEFNGSGKKGVDFKEKGYGTGNIEGYNDRFAEGNLNLRKIPPGDYHRYLY